MGDFKNEFFWSFSRGRVFDECRRKYYYNHYGFWGGWAKAKSDKIARTLYVLKHLQTRRQWKGTTVHNEIARLLRQLVSTGKLTPIEKSLSRVTNLMREKFKFSRKRGYWEEDGSLRDVTALFEHEYGINVSDDVWKTNHRDAVECIRNFYKSDVPEKIGSLDKNSVLTVDRIKPSSFYFNDETLFVNLDLAYRVGDRVNIVDWKTGAGESDGFQFLVYTIYINEVFKTPLENVSVIEYNLLSEEKIIHRFTSSEVEEGKERITENIEKMKSYLRDAAENTAVITDFPRTDDEGECNLCNFKKICFDLP